MANTYNTKNYFAHGGEQLVMTKFLTAKEALEPDEDLSLEERVTRLERRVAQLEVKDGAVG